MTDRIVEVVWEDSACVSAWHNEEDIPGAGDPIRSVGFVYRDDDTGVVLIQSMNEVKDGPSTRTSRFSATLIIPRSAIREVRELGRKRR